ncbi:putative UDP-rhamnose:rhamnosyltransferase 1 [Nymphaea colorata]|uniref:Glycosyltransferase N-terminal domain-containing protein n=1 Tax=Nymphaea colorata TaxID=210225 RepID=A0A5K1C431_9MAGN|nr:putative UDP-rhamnose:rhamnosyltransferase 1 [Nymphaea colorata]
MGEKQCHVVMVPWLAFGHLIPFLELSNALAAKGINISFLCTPRNIEKLRPKIPRHLTSRINLLGFPLPPVAGLLENAEATFDLEQDAVQYLKKAYDMLQEPLEKLVKSTSPDLIIYDFAAYWAPPIALKLSVPCSFYSVFTAGSTCITRYLLKLSAITGRQSTPEDLLLANCFSFPSPVRYKLHEAVRLCSGIGHNASGVSDVERFESAFRGCQSLLVRTCMEFEGEYVAALQEICQKPVIPIGMLPAAAVEEEASSVSSPEWVACLRWLDQRDPRSVVFVAFGTEARLSKEEIEAIAAGLELSNLPFCWILRRPSHVSASSTAGGGGPGGNDKEDDVDDPLPPGFRDRTAQRGFISMSWVPQVKVLAHGSIGACLYHAGMSSTMEALQFGLPLVLLPMVIDQGLVARLLVEKKVGVEVERDEKDGRFTGLEVAKALRLVMVEDEGKIILEKARELKSKFDDQELNDGYINRLVKLIRGQGNEEDEEKASASNELNSKPSTL